MVGETGRARNNRLAKLNGMPERSADGAGHLAIAKGPRRYLYLLLAGVFFVLACVGVLLPGLPTTPFLLLTSYFLLRSSPSLNRKLMQSRVFGRMLRDWHRRGALRPRVKAFSLLACSSVILLSVFSRPHAGYRARGRCGGRGLRHLVCVEASGDPREPRSRPDRERDPVSPAPGKKHPGRASI